MVTIVEKEGGYTYRGVRIGVKYKFQKRAKLSLIILVVVAKDLYDYFYVAISLFYYFVYLQVVSYREIPLNIQQLIDVFLQLACELEAIVGRDRLQKAIVVVDFSYESLSNVYYLNLIFRDQYNAFP